ncbi:MAG: serine/threonine protein phosphatase [Marinosulfonomonas sp.]|nr:MAG: serine/threonine protein phosphatase [Marinosulfonomonas sp.]
MPVPPRPEFPVVAIGDIHGRADLLALLLDKISQQAPGATLIFVGDYVDRGPDSRGVISKLRELDNAICLRGNHEAMLLEFIDDPIEKGGRWLRNGGVDTLASFGISLGEDSNTDEVLNASKSLQNALADGTEDWLRALPIFWQSGNLLVTHAGPDPATPIADQSERDFLWGHRRFLRDNRSDGIWVAHGHWVRDRANFGDGRIGVDTGAWASGRLTAALIKPDGTVLFIDIHKK